jgi:hypothetical protein
MNNKIKPAVNPIQLIILLNDGRLYMEKSFDLLSRVRSDLKQG